MSPSVILCVPWKDRPTPFKLCEKTQSSASRDETAARALLLVYKLGFAVMRPFVQFTPLLLQQAHLAGAIAA